ncbi:MAG: hypothetical protein HC923_03155 [Myxococcales bacterium]|nr:hypothetical protein [Myxococcales bacterium]
MALSSSRRDEMESGLVMQLEVAQLFDGTAWRRDMRITWDASGAIVSVEPASGRRRASSRFRGW